MQPAERRSQKSQWKQNHTVATLRKPIRSGLDRLFNGYLQRKPFSIIRDKYRVALARYLSVAEKTLRSHAPFTWNESKGKTVCLVVKCGCHCSYTNENSDHGNQKQLQNVALFSKQKSPTIFYGAIFSSLILWSRLTNIIGGLHKRGNTQKELRKVNKFRGLKIKSQKERF